MAKFLGKRLNPKTELTSDFRTRIEGTRIAVITIYPNKYMSTKTPEC